VGIVRKVLGFWRAVDERLHRVSEGLQKAVRTLRILRFTLVLAILVVLASAVVGLLWPRWFPIAYAVATIFLVIPLMAFLVMVALPLRAKRVVAWIDMGYPENTRRVAMQAAAERLHKASHETEDLIVETIANESRKVLAKYRERARQVNGEAEAEVRT
jgi:hypothetical protein